MILYELASGTEDNPAYRTLEAANAVRHYNFLQSAIVAALSTNCHFLSQTLLKAFNYHAIACLHTKAGEFRPCAVEVGEYRAPDPYRVQDLMDDLVNSVNLKWEATEPVPLAS